MGGMKSGMWVAMDQRIINNAVAQWCQPLRTCVQAVAGGHFEHLLQFNKKTKTIEKFIHKNVKDNLM